MQLKQLSRLILVAAMTIKLWDKTSFIMVMRYSAEIVKFAALSIYYWKSSPFQKSPRMHWQHIEISPHSKILPYFMKTMLPADGGVGRLGLEGAPCCTIFRPASPLQQIYVEVFWVVLFFYGKPEVVLVHVLNESSWRWHHDMAHVAWPWHIHLCGEEI